MDAPACIRLPFLRQTSTGQNFALYLSPGHAEPDSTSWRPASFPLAPVQARQFLASLKGLSLPELETMRLQARRNNFRDQIQSLDEAAALAQFCGGPEQTDSFEQGRLMAQKLLLWRWHWEECQAEIADLARACAESEALLPSHFREDGAPVTDCREPDQGDDTDPLWRPVAANAAFFLPPETAILAEGEMAADLGDLLDFQPAGQEIAQTGKIQSAKAPLWQALGHSRPASGSAARIYNPLRTWLIWSEQ